MRNRPMPSGATCFFAFSGEIDLPFGDQALPKVSGQVGLGVKANRGRPMAVKQL